MDWPRDWDLTLPGYKYLGPGNPLDNGQPTSYNDWVAYFHDIGYGKILEEGGHPYMQWSEADAQAYKAFRLEGFGGVAAKGFFGFKKLLHDIGVISKVAVPSDNDGTTTDESMDIPQSAGNLRGGLERVGEKRSASAAGMDATQPAQGSAERSAMSSGGGAATGAQETPVDMNVTPEMGIMTETRTALLPWTGFVSMNANDYTAPTVLKIRLNAPYNIMSGNTLATQTISSTRAKGLSNDQATSSLNNGAALATFPVTIVGPTAKTATTSSAGVPTDASCIPAYRTWYQKLYESYHTMSCAWKLTIENASDATSTDQVVLWEYDAYTATDVGNIIPTDATLHQTMHWPKVVKKHIKFNNASNANRSTDIKVIEGTWVPGSVAKNTANAEDIKTWYTTGAAPSPQWVENLVVMAYKDQFANGTAHLNIRIDLLYKVQFKDLKRVARYPKANDTDINLSIPDDVLQTPNDIETV